jgi:hypothetical protein
MFLSGIVFARKPAIEDFVGVESNEPIETMTEETKTLYEFNDKLQSHGQGNFMDQNYHWLLILGILSLPIVSWLVIMKSSMKNKNEQFEENVRILSKYKSKNSNDDDQNFPKAS